jgi:hypothetical protein
VQGVEEVLASVPTWVTPVMNNQLRAPFDSKEVKKALFEMYPMKAPGIDGFPTHFFPKTLGFVRRRGDKSCITDFIRRG